MDVPYRRRWLWIPGSPLRVARNDGMLQTNIAEIDADAEPGVECFLPAFGRDFDLISPGVLCELVEFEIAIVISGRRGDRLAALEQPHGGALDAVDDVIGFRRHRAADEAGRVAPEIAIIDACLSGEIGPHHFEPLVARHTRHLVVLYLDRAHGAGGTRLLSAGLLPALVDEMGVKGPDLRHLEFLVPPDVAVGAGIDEVLAALRLLGIDQDDAVVTLLHGVAAFLEA